MRADLSKVFDSEQLEVQLAVGVCFPTGYLAIRLATTVIMSAMAHAVLRTSDVKTRSPSRPKARCVHTMTKIKLMSPKPAAIAIIHLPSLTWEVVSKAPPIITANLPVQAIRNRMSSMMSMTR